MTIPEFQNLQNKKFSVNLNITGRDQQELFDNYKDMPTSSYIIVLFTKVSNSFLQTYLLFD